MSKRKLSEAGLEQHRQAPTTHGAYSYMSRTKTGAPITLTMAEVERSILLEVETDGPRERIRKQAIRFGVAAELLWGHMQTSAEAFDSCLHAFTWLAGAEIRAWRDWHAMGGKGDGLSAADVLDAMKDGKREQGQ